MLRVGIDLGTTNTVVSYIDKNGEWQKLCFENGRLEDRCLLPSMVAIYKQLPVVGQEAVEHSMQHPRECCSNRKREMGQRSNSWLIGTEYLSAEKISEYILKEVYNELKRKFPEETFNAFVTVPAGFTNNARIATKKALIGAGFDVDENCLADEPVSAAIAYSSELSDNDYVLVVDIGGGTFDLCLLNCNIVGSTDLPTRIIPISVGSDLNNGLFLAGDAVDEVIFNYMVKEFNKENGCNVPLDIYNSSTATDEEIKAAVAMKSMILDAKKAIYSGHDATCFKKNIIPGKDLDITITRETYCSLMAEPFVSNKIKDDDKSEHFSITEGYKFCIDNLFKGIEPGIRQKINKVLLVGGMAHEICLYKILKNQFANVIVAPEKIALYLVSKGAAICNSNMRVKVENIAYSSIGIVLRNGEAVSNIINEGSKIDGKTIYEHTFEVESKDATAVKIMLVEYRGKYNQSDFNRGKYAVILDENVQLMESNPTFWERLGIKGRKKVKLICRFTDDKILLMCVKHGDKTRLLDVKLGR